MKTILYVYTASSIGGGSYAMLNIIRALDRSKYIPVVLLQRDGPLVEELKAIKVDVLFLPLLNTVPYNSSLINLSNIARILRILKSFSQFRAVLDKINPDIVYLNTMMLHPYLQVIGERHIKSIIHVREHWPEAEHVIQRNWAIDNIRKYADEVVAINEYSAAMVANEQCRPTIVYDWIDMSKRSEKVDLDEMFGMDSSTLKVYLCAGGYDPIKGTLEVMRAFSEVVKDENARLLVFGTKPKFPNDSYIKRVLKNNEDREYCEMIDKVLNKDERIKIVPNTYFITEYYKKAYCILSYFRIPHANLSLAENIILGTPVIAARNEESIEYSMNGTLAILFNANDFSDFKGTLMKFDNDRQLLVERLNEHSTVIKDKFDPEKNIEKLSMVYNRLINRN